MKLEGQIIMKSNSTKSLKGEYVFYKDGVEVCRSKNIITNEGKEAIINYLSRQTSEYAAKIVLGVGTTAASATDEFLDFEVFPVAVSFRTVDFTQTPTQLVFRATLPLFFKGVITEAGLATIGGVLLGEINDINDNVSLVSTFDSDFESWTIPSGVAYVANDLEGTPLLRIGDSGLQISVSSGTVTSEYDNVTSYFAPYSDIDVMKVAFNVATAVPTSLVLKFENDSSNYYTVTIPSSSMSLGYNIESIAFSNFVATGNPLIQNTVKISVSVTSSTASVVTMDGIRFDEYSDLDKSTLVSRSILSTPLVVEGGFPFDVEYRVGFDL